MITAIDNCTNFILVLGANSLERCTDDSDWLYNEIKEALQRKKNIICVFTDDVQFPETLPEEIDDIRYQNGLKFDIFYFENFIDKLIWEDELCNKGEIELTCFTECGLYNEVEKFINEHHSYELCELICLPIINISDGFGKWISEYTGKIKFDL